MSNQLDDFLISLGFDTKKVKSQLNDLQKSLQSTVDKIDKKREAAGKKAVKQKLTDEQIVQRAIEKRQLNELKRENDLLKLAKKKAQLSKDVAMSVSKVESARRQQEVRALINAEKNPQLKSMGNYYRQMQSSLIGSKRLETRRRGIVNTVRNVGAYRDFAATAKGSDERKLLAQILLQARKDAREDKYYRVRQLRADLVKRGRDAVASGGMKAGFDIAGYRQTQLNNAVGMGQIGKGFQSALERQLAKATTKSEVNRTIGTVGRISRMRGADANIVANAGNVDQLKRYGEQLARNNAELNTAARRSFGLAAAQGSLRDSTRNLVREYASLYALFAGTSYINQTGQAFESIESSMLAATGNTKDAAAEMQYMIDLSKRLGLRVKEVSNEYTKFKFSAKGKISTEQQQELFTSVSELGTVLGISQERMKLSMNAMSQMMSKTTVQADELKNQLAESLPGSIGIFARALGISEKELFKLMEDGKLISAEVLPKVAKEMRRVANEGGALELKLGSARVAQGQFFNELDLASKKVFGDGYSTGLSVLFKTLATTLGDNGSSLESLGNSYNKAFKLMAKAVEALTPIVTWLIRSLEALLVTLDKISELTNIKLVAGIVLLTRHFALAAQGAKTFGGVMAAALRTPLVIITGILSAIDEIRGYFDANVIGLFDDPNMSQKDREVEAAQRRKMFGFSMKGDESLLSGAGISTDPSFMQQVMSDQVATRQNSNIPSWAYPIKLLESGASLIGTARRSAGQGVQSMVFNIHGVADVAQLKKEIQDAVVRSQDSAMIYAAAGRD